MMTKAADNMEQLAKMHRDEMNSLCAIIAQKPPAPDYTKFITPLLVAVCVFYVTGTLKQSENSAISVPVITEKLAAIQTSILKLEAQLATTQADSKGLFKDLENRVRTIELSIFKDSAK